MHHVLKTLVALSGCAALTVVVRVGAEPAPGGGAEKYAVKVPGGISLGECRGYEKWETISISYNNGRLAVIAGNPAMINAYKAGIPGNGKPFPNGARMAKIHWDPKKNEIAPGPPLVPDKLHDVDCMTKDSARFADSGGWGYGAFEYDNATNMFAPSTTANQPPQGNDAKCGFACHTIVKSRDYVFTQYAPR